MIGTQPIAFTRTTIILAPQEGRKETQYVYRIQAQNSDHVASFTLILPNATRLEECVILLARDGLHGSQPYSVAEYADEFLVDDADADRIKKRMESIAGSWLALGVPFETLDKFYEETLG